MRDSKVGMHQNELVEHTHLRGWTGRLRHQQAISLCPDSCPLYSRTWRAGSLPGSC